jgi:hypothetical protein
MSRAAISRGDWREIIRHEPGPWGKVRAGSPGAKTPSVGTLNADATCIGPESCPMNSFAREIATATAVSDPRDKSSE